MVKVTESGLNRQCSLGICNLKGQYDPLSDFFGGQFVILEGHKNTLLLQLSISQ